MKKLGPGLIICTILFFLIFGWVFAQSVTHQNSSSLNLKSKISVITQQGGRPSWSGALNLIAFDRAGEDGYFDVYVVRPDGSGLRCLTDSLEYLPQLNHGNPNWHPSGKYLVFQAQDPQATRLNRLSFLATQESGSPAQGVNNNLWLMDIETDQCWQLTYIKPAGGVLHPRFSPDGTQLLWNELIVTQNNKKQWVIRVAKIEMKNNLPRLYDVETLQTGFLQACFACGFSSNGKQIIFSGSPRGRQYTEREIYTLDLQTNKVTRLTFNHERDEYAKFSPDGKYIIWASSEDIPQRKRSDKPRLDYWIMPVQGLKRQQLTHFNQKDSVGYLPGGISAGDFDWSPDSKAIAAHLVRWKESAQHSPLVMITFDDDDCF